MYEQQIQKAILTALRVHPKVCFAERFNSGAVITTYKGRKSFTRFNTLEGCPDILFMFKTGILGAVEVKRPPWKGPTDDRERKQEIFLNKVRNNGGFAMFAWDVNMVLEALDEL